MSWLWPFGKIEKRSGGGYTDAIVQAIEAYSVATVADVSSTAAVEAVAGLLSRTLSAAKVDGASWLRDSINPPWLAMVGRSLVREGASLSVIRATEAGLHLVPAANWTFETLSGEMLGEIEDEWQARVTTYGPSASTTRTLGRDEVVYVRWGASPGTPYRGRGPTSWASLASKMNAETERSLGDEAAGPIAQLLSIPSDGGDDEDEHDPLAMLKADVKAARGKALFVETTQTAWGDGKQAAPQRDWAASRLGSNPPEGARQAERDGLRTHGGSGRRVVGPVRRLGRHEQERSTATLAYGHGCPHRQRAGLRTQQAVGDGRPTRPRQLPPRCRGKSYSVQEPSRGGHGHRQGARRVRVDDGR